MKILVLSDTHGDLAKAEKAIRKNLDIDMVIHLGDYFRDAEKLSGMFPKVRFEYIYGNCDFMVGDVPPEKLLEIEGKKLFLTHGHRYSVKWDYDKLHSKARELKVDMLLFGHTHVTTAINGYTYMLINPGSISEPRNNSDESYAIIEIKDGNIDYRLMSA